MAASPPQWTAERLTSITRWYGTRNNLDPSAPGQADLVLAISPDSTDGRILDSIQDVLDGVTEPPIAATNLASVVFSADKPVMAWLRMLYNMTKAAEYSSYTEHLRLAELMVSLARLPHSLPSPEITNATGDPSSSFSELPGFGFTLSEELQGPRQYICNLQPLTVPACLAASKRWQHLNAFAAQLTLAHSQDKLPSCVDFSRHATWIMAKALEHGRPKPMVDELQHERFYMQDRAILWLPAATQWAIVAASEVLHAALRDAWRARAGVGPMWRAEGGGVEFSIERWRFWERRLREIAELSDAFDDEVLDAAARAADRMADCTTE